MLAMQTDGRRTLFRAVLVLAVSLPAIGVLADDGHDHAPAPAAAAPSTDHEPRGGMMVMPMMNAERGMLLFAEKGCVACHSVNGVGGHDASPLDVHTMKGVMNPFEFAAKMWRMAPVMIAAQEEALGGQILFTGEELANIIAFVHDDAQQHLFSETMLSPRVRKMMDHQHDGGKSGTDVHAGEIGHTH